MAKLNLKRIKKDLGLPVVASTLRKRDHIKGTQLSEVDFYEYLTSPEVRRHPSLGLLVYSLDTEPIIIDMVSQKVVKVNYDRPYAYVNFRGYNINAHKIVAEAYAGRELKQGESIHHRDLDRTNNLHYNLSIMTEQEHRQLHIELAARRQSKLSFSY